MSGARRLIAAFEDGSLQRPSAAVPNLVDLAQACAMLSGAPVVGPSQNARAIVEAIGPSDHLVLVLVDGLGLDLVEGLTQDAFFRAHLLMPLQTVFPSTTAVSLTSLATATQPNEHAITGRWTHLPEAGPTVASVLHYTSRSERRPLAALGVPPEKVFPMPSVLGSFERDTLSVLPERIAASVYSAYFSGDTPRLGYKSFEQAIDAVVARIGQASQPTFTYLYTDGVDSLAHTHGVTGPEVSAAVSSLDRQLARLSKALAGRATVTITADHGFLDAPAGTRHQLRGTDPLMALLRSAPSGDARVLYLHIRDGTEERLRQHFWERFGERFALVTVDEAETLELFGPGPLASETRRRMGDFVAISTGQDVIAYHAGSGISRAMLEASQHSGLSPAEMCIPLIVSR